METFNLQVRELSKEEKTILFGKILAPKINAVKALNADEYVEIFSALHSGKFVSLSGFSATGYSRVYVYCDLPVGSRYFTEELGSYRSTTRAEIYDIPIQNFVSKLNEFFVPVIKDSLSIFSTFKHDNKSAGQYHGSLSGDYNQFLDTCMSGCFLNMQDNQVISIVSYNALRSLYSQMHIPTCAGANASEMENIWMYTQFLIPKTDATNIPMPSNVKNAFVPFLESHKNAILNGFATLFSWSSNSMLDFAVADDYVKYNGMYMIGPKKYLGLSNTGYSPITEYASGPGLSYGRFSHNFEHLVFTGTSKFDPSGIFRMTSSSSRSYCSNDGSTVLLNMESMTRTRNEVLAGLPELVELDSTFFDSLFDMVKEEVETNKVDFEGSDARTKFRKREFAIKREAAVNLSEVLNNRYEVLSTNDNKLVVLTKTSKAKDAAKKMAITRKISVAMEPVIDLALAIFAASDMETGVADSYCRLPFAQRNALANVTYNVGQAFLKALEVAKVEYVKYDTALAESCIKGLYESLHLDSELFFGWHPKYVATRYRDSFHCLDATTQDARALEYLHEHVMSCLSNSGIRGLFSPSSGMLNLFHFGTCLYRNNYFSSFTPELQHLKYKAPYGNTNVTGKQMHHLYINNFIGDNQEVTDNIERLKNQDYASGGLVTATTAFTFSESALATMVKLKKAKTFTDYSRWFEDVKPELVSRLHKLLAGNGSDALKTTLFLILDHFNTLLSSLKEHEKDYLPEEKEKKRGRKKKEEVEDEEESADNNVVVSKEEQSATLALLKSLASHSVGVKQHDNTAASK